MPDIRMVRKIRRLNWPEFYDAHRNGDVKNVPPRDRNETIVLLLGCGRSFTGESYSGSPQEDFPPMKFHVRSAIEFSVLTNVSKH